VETPTLPVHKVYSILWLLCLCVGLVFQSPSVPSKISSNSMSNSSNLFWSWRLRWVHLALTTDWRSAFLHLPSRIWTTHWVTSWVLCGLCAMLLFTAQAFSMFDVIRLLTSLIGKMIWSIVISFVHKSRTIPSSFMVLHPRMRSYTNLVICFLVILYNAWCDSIIHKPVFVHVHVFSGLLQTWIKTNSWWTYVWSGNEPKKWMQMNYFYVSLPTQPLTEY
jgi:hypothetical protein